MAIEHIRDVLERITSLMKAYESPTEERLGERLRSAINPTARFQTQVWVDTWARAFRNQRGRRQLNGGAAAR